MKKSNKKDQTVPADLHSFSRGHLDEKQKQEFALSDAHQISEDFASRKAETHLKIAEE